MKLLAQVPEQPITETFGWLTDVMVSNNGTEQRVSNSDLPGRAFSSKLQFDSEADLRAHVNGMFVGSKVTFQVPLYHYATMLKAPAASAQAVVMANTRRTELREGMSCLVYDRNGYELHTVLSIAADSVTLGENLVRAFPSRAWICPVSTVYARNNSQITFGNVDTDARADLNVQEPGFLSPFVNEFNNETVTLLNGVPVLTAHPIGREFEVDFDTGINIFDEGGIVTLYSPWTHTQLQMARTFLVERWFNPEVWDLWRVFLDTVKGRWKSFYFPTFRKDFDINVLPVAGGTTLRFTGTDYLVDWYPNGAFKGVALFNEAGLAHYARVTNCTNVGGNSNVTFTPAVPGDFGVVDRVSLLLRVRLASDTVTVQHYGRHSMIDLSLRTVDE